ncbi:hypothetical protein [Embleya sp. NPDC020630]|uniref:hypothetical protein n=1 Tax=Embleya sp. NPDC020630 TaxID=3363979 RepID=UPI00379EF5FC
MITAVTEFTVAAPAQGAFEDNITAGMRATLTDARMSESALRAGGVDGNVCGEDACSFHLGRGGACAS